jgi:hypothetical protein
VSGMADSIREWRARKVWTDEEWEEEEWGEEEEEWEEEDYEWDEGVLDTHGHDPWEEF